MANNSKGNITKNTIWKFAERITAQGVTFVVSMVLARLIAPEEYGIIALVNIFITLSTVVVTFGINSALIQKKDADDLDFTTALYLNVVAGISLYLFLFIAAPTIATFYGEEVLIPIIRILGLTLIIYSINSIQQAYISRTMQFKLFFFSTIIGTIISAVIGIWMAYRGFGVWALVIQMLANSFLDMLILFFSVSWRPKLLFSRERAKYILNYGVSVLGAQMMNSVYSEFRGLVIGKVYKAEVLSCYNKGKQIPMMIEVNLDLSIASVIFTSFSLEQDNHDRFLDLYRKTVMVASFITFPMLFGLFAVADNIIYVLYSSKWMECVPFLRLMCAGFLFYGIDSTSVLAMRALGYVKEGIKIEIAHKIIMVVLMIAALFTDIYMLVGTEIVSNILHLLFVARVLKKNIKYGFWNIIKDVDKNILSSFSMLLCIYLIGLIISNRYLALAVQIIAGIIIYISISVVVKNKTLFVLLDMIKLKIKIIHHKN